MRLGEIFVFLFGLFAAQGVVWLALLEALMLIPESDV